MLCCRKCEHYKKKNLKGFSLSIKIRSVSGFCMDSTNPDFNEYAQAFGRGIGRIESYTSPTWCAKRNNPTKTKEIYSAEDIHAFTEQEKEIREIIKSMNE
jgi:hypothetical protein